MLKQNLTDINQQLLKTLALKNPSALPRLNKVVINCRIPEVKESPDALDSAVTEIMAITAQKPAQAKAKKAIASFKLRQNDLLALKVTLRGVRMYDFVEKLFNLVLPRLRDFRGLPLTSFDANGNYNMTIKDQTYFPEVNLDKVGKIRSLQITFSIQAKSIEESKALLSALGLPFVKES